MESKELLEKDINIINMLISNSEDEIKEEKPLVKGFNIAFLATLFVFAAILISPLVLNVLGLICFSSAVLFYGISAIYHKIRLEKAQSTLLSLYGIKNTAEKTLGKILEKEKNHNFEISKEKSRNNELPPMSNELAAKLDELFEKMYGQKETNKIADEILRSQGVKK